MTEDNNVLVRVEDLKMHFPIYRGVIQRQVGAVRAVDGVSFSIRKGETLGLVGESGCGKSTTGRTILQLYKPTTGKVFYEDVELTKLHPEKMRLMRKNIQMIFQDPYASLNPRMTIRDIIAEPLVAFGSVTGKAVDDRVRNLMKLVKLDPDFMLRYPHEFSGGQRQRIGIARAMANNPTFVVCDEPISALDVSIQAQVLNLLEDLQAEFDLTYLFIAHDLSVVEHISDRVAVMYVGRLVEMASTDELYYHPKHPYTEALMAAVPKPDPRRRDRPIKLPGEVASPANPPSGCYFHPRCRYAKDICSKETPPLEEVEPDHFAACHFSRELTLRGVVVG